MHMYIILILYTTEIDTSIELLFTIDWHVAKWAISEKSEKNLGLSSAYDTL